MLIQGRKWDCGEEAATVLLEKVNTGTGITRDYYRGIWRIIHYTEEPEYRLEEMNTGTSRDQNTGSRASGHLGQNRGTSSTF